MKKEKTRGTWVREINKLNEVIILDFDRETILIRIYKNQRKNLKIVINAKKQIKIRAISSDKTLEEILTNKRCLNEKTNH